MSDYNDDDFDDESNDGDNGTDLVKNLRRQLKAQKRLLDEATTELSTYRSEKRTKSVADLIEQAGGNPKYAKFYTSEDASEAAIAAWIQSEKELLGVKEPEQPDPQAQQIELLNSAVNGAPQVKMGSAAELIDKIRSAKTRAELDSAMSSAFPASRP